jgi:hypothetical protein
MNKPSSIVRKGLVAFAAVLAIAGAGSALAAPGGGGGGGHGGGGGGRAAGGGGFHGGGGGYRGGGYGGYRGGYGGRGYYGGRYYGGYRGGYGGWGYGWRGGWGCCGLGLGWYLPVLPLGYATYWWGGVPYYYANSSYYTWDSGVGQYEAVEPPEGLSTAPSEGSTPAPAGNVNSPAGAWTDLFAYPKGGQSTEQQNKDKDECHKWAVGQTGFDPTQPPLTDARSAAVKREGYLRAEAACLEGRNYSVK